MQVRTNSIFKLMGALSLVVILLSGCLKDVENTPPRPMAYMSVMHLASRGPSVELFFNGEKKSNPFTLGAYTENYTAIDPGAFSITFKKAGADSTVATIPTDIYDSLKFYTVVTYNTPDTQVRAELINDDYTVLTGDKAYYRFWHLSPDITDEVDVYINQDKVYSTRYYADNIIGSSMLNQFSSVTAGTYSLYVKKAGTDSVIATTNSSFNNGNAYTIFLKGIPGNTTNDLSLKVLAAAR